MSLSKSSWSDVTTMSVSEELMVNLFFLVIVFISTPSESEDELSVKRLCLLRVFDFFLFFIASFEKFLDTGVCRSSGSFLLIPFVFALIRLACSNSSTLFFSDDVV